MQINELKAADSSQPAAPTPAPIETGFPPQPAGPVPVTSQSSHSDLTTPTTAPPGPGYPDQPAYQSAPEDNSNRNPAASSTAPSGTGYPPQPAYPSTTAPAPTSALNDNSAKIAQLTAEMMECAKNDLFERAMELQEQVSEFSCVYP